MPALFPSSTPWHLLVNCTQKTVGESIEWSPMSRRVELTRMQLLFGNTSRLAARAIDRHGAGGAVRHTNSQPTIYGRQMGGSSYRPWCSRLQPGTSSGSRQCGFQKPRHVEPMLELPTKFQVLVSVTWKLNMGCHDGHLFIKFYGGANLHSLCD